MENLQREDLNPLEEAAGFQYLIDEYGLTQEELARRLGKSRPAIANTLRLLGLSDAIKAMLVDSRLSAGHARALLSAPEANRGELAQRAVDEGLTVRALERLVRPRRTVDVRKRRRFEHSRLKSVISKRACASDSEHTLRSCVTVAAGASSFALATTVS